MAFDAEAAKKSGYSDAEIADYLGQQSKFDVPGARKSGYSDGEIVAHLTAKPDVLSDVAKSFGGGLSKAVGGIADAASAFSPVGVVNRVISNVAAGKNPFMPDMSSVAGTFFANRAPDHKPQTTAGEVAHTVGEYSPAALLPGSLLARAGNVFLPAAGSEVAGRVAHHFNAPAPVEQGVRAAGAILGGVGASARFTAKAVATPDETVGNVFAQRTKADPTAMAQKAADMRSAGVQPSLIDVGGTQGQRLVKAVGITNPDAGEALQVNAGKVSATTKPAVMARTRSLPGGPRTAEKLASDLDTARSTEAQTTYAEPYAASLELKDLNVIQALRDPEGAGAINRAITAARSRMDYKALADLEALKVTANGPTGNGQVWPTTGRALDRVQIAFGNKGRALSQNGSKDIASGMFMRQDRINGLLDSVEGLGPARAAYRAKSQAIDVLNKPGVRKDPFSTDPADYKAWVDALPPEAQHANHVAIRQEILDTLGGQRASTVGSVDELATSPYVRENLTHALGQKEAGAYLDHLTARLEQKRNASQVSPYAGSPTKMLQNDTAGLDKAIAVADVGHKVVTGNWFGLGVKLAAHLKAMGISDADAQTLAHAATDPKRLDGVIAAIAKAKGPKAARSFVNFRGGLVGAVRSGGLTRPQPQPAR